MTYAQIRINKTKKLEGALQLLQRRYPLLSEAEIIKMLISEAVGEDRQTQRLNKDLLLASHVFGVDTSDTEEENFRNKNDIKPLVFSS